MHCFGTSGLIEVRVEKSDLNASKDSNGKV